MKKQKLRQFTGLKIIMVLGYLFCWNVMFAQIDVTGYVKDEIGKPIAGATVTLKGSSLATQTTASGSFLLKVTDKNAILLVTSLGYETSEVAVGNQRNLNIILKSSAKVLDDVVVVGYGVQKKTKVTGAVGSVDGKELTKRVAPNASSLLQGRVPGLQVVQNSANPGAEKSSLQIRGQGTFSGAGSNPLVLIDGVEGNMDKLNPNVISNITVLKDASSAAIYGSRAANGVILITTKGGQEGRLNVDYSFNFAAQSPTTKPKRITNSAEYMRMMNSALVHTKGDLKKNGYPEEIISRFEQNQNDAVNYPNYDWYDDVIKTAYMKQHFLSVNGGKSGTTYNFGFGYLDQDGMVIKTGYKRYDAQLNLKTDLGSRVTFGTNINFSKGKRDETAYTKGGSTIEGDATEDLILTMLAQGPYYRPYLADGTGRFTSSGFPDRGHNKPPTTIAYGGGGKLFNENYVLGSAFAKVKILDGLDAEIKGSVRYQQEQAKALTVSVAAYTYFPTATIKGSYDLKPTDPGERQESIYNSDKNTLTVRNRTESQYTFYGTLNYAKTFSERHNIGAMLGYNQEYFRFDELNGYRNDVPTNNIWELDAVPTAGQTTGGNAYEWAMQSYFGRFNYDYQSKYLFEASFRSDGSSRFAKGNRWGFFPSLSGGWRASEEQFLKDVKWLNDLKIRASWGRLGNQNIGNYPYQEVLEALKYNFGGSVVQGLWQSGIANTNIRWETTTATDAGIDFALFNHKLFGTVDWYRKYTTDILRELQVPDHIGVVGPTVNNGEMENKGWEFALGHRNKIGEFSYSLNANLDTYKNKLVRFGAREINSGNGIIKQEGLPWESYFMYVFDGIYQNQAEIDNGPTPISKLSQPGDMKYKDINGDGKIGPEDRVVVDGAFPNFNYGFTLNAAYKGFDFSAFFQGVEGKKVYVKEWGVAPFRQGSPPPAMWRDAWTGEGTSNTIPHLFNDNYAPNTQVSTWWLQDASYLRLKNIQFGYTLPKQLLSKIGFQQLRIYFSGDNLFTMTNFFDGLDPERTARNSRGAIYPQAKIVSFGVKGTL